MRILMAAALLAGSAVAEAPHPCAGDAVKRAGELLAFHFEGPEAFSGEGTGAERQTWTIDGEVKVLAPIRALKGKGKLDVLEVWGYIYKASYRMRFIYAQIPDTCVLIGQEVLEESDPY
ncbi:MAG: hypothetical protein QM698_01765 [Micropepsaceae bacterium]